MTSYEITDLVKRIDERGSLVVVESMRDIAFDVKRIYYIFDCKSSESRGFHAHRNLRQFAICLKGSCDFIMDNGKKRDEVHLDDPSKGITIEPWIWHEMHNLSDDCLLIVLASELYDESDYIRDYKTFIDEVNL